MSEEKQEELKPCPFCGSKSISRSLGEYVNGKEYPYIECDDCAGSSEPDTWNNRPNELVPSVEEIEKVIVKQRKLKCDLVQQSELEEFHLYATAIHEFITRR